jgi:hypothetical protein
MVGSLHTTMAAALLAVRVEVTNLYGLTATVLPLNLYIGLVHIVLPFQRCKSSAAKNSDRNERRFF